MTPTVSVGVKLYYRESIKMSCCMYQDMNWKLYRLAVIQLGSHNNCTEESSCIAASQSKCLAVPEHELETVFPRVNQNVLLYQSMSWKLCRLAVIQLDSYNNCRSQAVLPPVNQNVLLYQSMSWKLYRLAVIQLDSYNNWKSQAVLQLVNLDIAESLRLFVFNNERFTLWSRSLVSSTSLCKNTLFLSGEPSAFSISLPVGPSAIESNTSRGIPGVLSCSSGQISPADADKLRSWHGYSSQKKR